MAHDTGTQEGGFGEREGQKRALRCRTRYGALWCPGTPVSHITLHYDPGVHFDILSHFVRQIGCDLTYSTKHRKRDSTMSRLREFLLRPRTLLESETRAVLLVSIGLGLGLLLRWMLP